MRAVLLQGFCGGECYLIPEINALSDFNVEVEPIRQGGQQRGTLTGFRLHWDMKQPEEWGKVAAELLRSKIGRKARIRGTVESAPLPYQPAN